MLFDAGRNVLGATGIMVSIGTLKNINEPHKNNYDSESGIALTKPGRHDQNHPRGYETKSPPSLEALAGEVGVSRFELPTSTSLT